MREMLKVVTGIYLVTNCVFAARVYKPTNVVGTEPPSLLDVANTINVFDYHVSLRLKSSEVVKFGSGHFCSGVQITSMFVLTVAHCVQDVERKDMVVVTGGSVLAQNDNGTLVYRVRKVFIHESYSNITKKNDIALIELRSKGAKDTTSKMSVATPDSTLDLDNGARCETGGWSVIGKSDFSEMLKMIDVKFISGDVCNETTCFKGKIEDGMICAESKKDGASACIGDSGAGLFCQNRVVGLVAWGSDNCEKENLPVVYTDVGFYHDWIKKTFRKRCELEDNYLADASTIETMHIWVLHLNLLMLYLS